MGRYKKDYAVRANGDSLQFYMSGEYVGSLSLKKLCGYIKSKKQNNTEYKTTQKETSVFSEI